uniref:Protein kinase domain-containing protein n=1 Tax=Chrysotila carterae TaxID=13221 RepID=A0A7S4F554_CHRCT
MEASVDPSALNALLEQIAARFAEFSHISSEGSALQPMLMLGSETDASSFGWDQLMSSLPAEVQDAILQSAASLSAAGSTVDWTSAGIISGAALAGALSYSDSAQADQKKPLPAESTPYPTGRYDPEAAAEYFRARPLRVAQRVAFCARPVSWYLACLLVDWLRGEETLRANMRARAEQLVEALNELGPTCIKVGQALSIRADLIPLPYIEALAGLQDNVPAFPNVQARQLIAEELQLSDSTGGVDRLFRSLSSTPVAAASLGQVYRGVLKDGREVAVKVQRPDVLEPISLDLYLLRSLAKPFKESRNLNTDIVGLVDDWGRGFVDELDYTREAANSESFLRSIAKTPLASVVTAPEVVGELSTKRVLTTLWVNGARLELSAEDDVARLCGVALNAYLTMLLETGLLHCDPHPGNLLRTADGRLCILDWGLVTTLEPELQLRFLEHVAHLTAKDYAAVPADLVALGFVPANMEEAATSEGVVEALTDVYSQWAGGGGASKIDVSEVTGKLQALTEEKGNFFQIPPYFAYVLRAFSVLEGIALMNDPDYSVLNACLPYISQRVLSDPSPRSTNALRSFVYTNAPTAARAHRIGDAPPHRAPQVIDSKRFLRLFDGLQSFAASSGGLDADKEQQLETLAVQAREPERPAWMPKPVPTRMLTPNPILMPT